MTDMAETWKMLVAVAVLGAERGGEVSLPNDLAELTAIATEDEAALVAAAVTSTYMRAGIKPVIDTEAEPVPAPAAGNVPSASAADRLLTAIREQRTSLILEWCGIASLNNRVLPTHLLPELLRLAERDRSIRAAIQPVLGERGLWLASQNPTWQGLFVRDRSDPTQAWLDGTLEQRIQLLGLVRSEDPNVARGLIESTWQQDSPDDRAKFLEAMRTNPGRADEGLLESALDDRKKSVRDAAAELLARSVESAYAQRMTQRLAGLVAYSAPQTRLLRKKAAQLSVSLPAEPDTAAKRDGLVAKARDGMGPQAAMLSDIVAATPLAFWSQFNAAPSELISAAVAGDFAQPLLGGWLRAATRQGSPGWAEAMLRALIDPKVQKNLPTPDAQNIQALIKVLAKDQAELLMNNLLKASGPEKLEILSYCNFTWGTDLSRAALMAAQKRNLQTDWALRHWLSETAALRMHPSIAEEATRGWPDDLQPAARQSIDRFISVLQFRHDMHKELSS